MKTKLLIIPLLFAALGAICGYFIFASHAKPVSRNILIKARQYSYDPDHIEVNKGDTLHITLASLDVTHGFYLEGYNVDAEINANTKMIKVRKPSDGYNWTDKPEIVLIAGSTGKYRYRCSHTCGTMHPFMQGEMIVKPNNALHAGIGSVIGLALGLLFWLRNCIRKSGAE